MRRQRHPVVLPVRNQATQSQRRASENTLDWATMNEGIRVQINQLWKRKEDGLFIRVTGLIFLEPKRVIWQALPNQDNPSAYGTVTETEFNEQYEYQPQSVAVEVKRFST